MVRPSLPNLPGWVSFKYKCNVSRLEVGIFERNMTEMKHYRLPKLRIFEQKTVVFEILICTSSSIIHFLMELCGTERLMLKAAILSTVIRE